MSFYSKANHGYMDFIDISEESSIRSLDQRSRNHSKRVHICFSLQSYSLLCLDSILVHIPIPHRRFAVRTSTLLLSLNL